VLAAGVIALLGGLAATESRGGLIAALVAAVAALALTRERRMQTAVIGVVGATAFVTALLALSPVTLDHMTTIDAGGAGRSDLWRVATRMAQDRPVTGFGIGSFEHEEGNYVLQPGNLENVDKIVDRPAVTHNVYLQQLAETGVVGLLALLIACGACIAASQIAAGRFRARQDRAMDALARSVTVAMVGLLAASAFISNGADKRLWIVLALGPALLAASGPAVRAPAQLESTER
jgi:O-antigen ligase